MRPEILTTMRVAFWGFSYSAQHHSEPKVDPSWAKLFLLIFKCSPTPGQRSWPAPI